MRIYWALGLVFLAVAAQARVVEVEVQSRASVLGAQPFGEAGAYEKLSGVIRFAFDPDNRANAAIVDSYGLADVPDAEYDAHYEAIVLPSRAWPSKALLWTCLLFPTLFERGAAGRW